MANLSVEIAGIRFPNPVMPAAGPPVRDGRAILRCAAGGAGGLVSKTISRHAATPPTPNIAEIPHGMVISAAERAGSQRVGAPANTGQHLQHVRPANIGLGRVSLGKRDQHLRQELLIADACSGLRMLTIFCALAVAMVFLIERPWWDKFIILFSAVPIALIVNIIRISVTGILYWSSRTGQQVRSAPGPRLGRLVHDAARAGHSLGRIADSRADHDPRRNDAA